MLNLRPFIGLGLLVVLTVCCLPSTSAFSLQVYNDSACTLPLPAYSYTNSSLNYTIPSTHCINDATTAGATSPPLLSLAYSCSYTIAPPLVNVNLIGYTQPACGGNSSWVIYIPGNQTTGASGGPENVCTTMTYFQQGALSTSTVYGVVSCAAQSSNSGVRGAEVTVGLLATLIIMVGSLLM